MDLKRHKAFTIVIAGIYLFVILANAMFVHFSAPDVVLAGIVTLLVISFGVVIVRRYKRRFR